ncbi:MAG: YdiU family protein, partial [Pseudomonadota bacterium]
MLDMHFDNSYARLPARFFASQAPLPVRAPRLIAFNHPLARQMGLALEGVSEAQMAALFSGNTVPQGADPLAMAYAGHQFGGWVPQLGDGRAILLGEVLAQDGTRWDVQLKGAGRTPFSRGGDGRAWLGPVLREYLVSEAMAALGVPTTRALAAVTTGEDVARETLLPGAILTRVARSHIRVGTFQYFAARQDHDGLEVLTSHALSRHYPDRMDAEVPALALLEAAVEAQADLVARWMGFGFIHGVMNTDNCHVGGETIDYGPCAFMDAYHPETVFSSIDSYGRYAYQNQPQITQWNLAQLATALLPVIDGDEARAIELATDVINRFPGLYAAAWGRIFGAKLGLGAVDGARVALVTDLLEGMAHAGADFTQTFRHLAETRALPPALAQDARLSAWFAQWQGEVDGGADLTRTNPAIIPRNHQIEAVIAAAVAGDFGPFDRLHAA